MPKREEIRARALELYYELEGKGMEHIPTPEDDELKEAGFWLDAQRDLMTSEDSRVKEHLYENLDLYKDEIEKILDTLKELGEKPDGFLSDEELEKQITTLNNKLGQTERKLDKANDDIATLTRRKEELDALMSKERIAEPPKAAPEFGALRRREPDQAIEPTEVIEPEEDEEKEETEEAEPTRKGEKHEKGVRAKRAPTREEKTTELKTMTEEPSTRRKRPVRTRALAVPKTGLEAANDANIRMYDITMSMLEEGIRKGATNAPLGLISFMAYVDILHGGAYAAPISQRPFFMKDPTKSPYYSKDLQNTDVATGLGGFLASILGGLNAGPLVQEVMENANVPHVFPKLLSDEAYCVFKAVFAWMTTTDLLKSASTGVSTFVESTSKAFERLGKGIQAATPTEGQLKELLPLLSLLTAV